jgi:hypothetical protein
MYAMLADERPGKKEMGWHSFAEDTECASGHAREE